LDPKLGHRIIELAAVELVDRRTTGRNLHIRIDPERDIDAGATEVHGMTWDDLKGNRKFREVAAEFIEFAQGATWIIHNAPFDVGFLDAELQSAEMPACAAVYGGLIDTLALAREAYPGKRNNLDALCERFGVSNAHRTLHGALLDAQLLAEVYLAMTRGQESLTIDMGTGGSLTVDYHAADSHATPRMLTVIEPTPDEVREHLAYLEALDRETRGHCVWLRAAAAPQLAVTAP